MRTGISLLALLLVAASMTTGAAAQDPGTRLRVRVPHPFDGTVRRAAVLERVEGDTLWVQIDDQLTPLDLASARPHVSTGTRYGARGAVIGGLIGVVAGGIVGRSGYVAPDRRCSPGGYSMLFGEYGPSCSGGYDAAAHNAETVAGASAGLLFGVVGGYLLGSLIERWTPLEVAPAATADGVVGVSLSR